jgi:hypothetical protein
VTCNIPLESSRRGLQLCFRLHCNRSSAQEVMRPQSPGSPSWRDFGTPTRESPGSPGSERPFGCELPGESQSILYGGRWWLPPSPDRGESCVSKCPWLVPTPKGVPNAKLTSRGWFSGCKFTQAKLVPLPSLIPGLPTRPSTPF